MSGRKLVSLLGLVLVALQFGSLIGICSASSCPMQGSSCCAPPALPDSQPSIGEPWSSCCKLVAAPAPFPAGELAIRGRLSERQMVQTAMAAQITLHGSAIVDEQLTNSDYPAPPDSAPPAGSLCLVPLRI